MSGRDNHTATAQSSRSVSPDVGPVVDAPDAGEVVASVGGNHVETNRPADLDLEDLEGEEQDDTTTPGARGFTAYSQRTIQTTIADASAKISAPGQPQHLQRDPTRDTAPGAAENASAAPPQTAEGSPAPSTGLGSTGSASTAR